MESVAFVCKYRLIRVSEWDVNMRITKAPEERIKEILDVSEQLFTTRGYSNVTVTDIVKKIGISNGAFYHYFKSKEEVLDAVLLRIASGMMSVAKAIAKDGSLTAIEKILEIARLTTFGGKDEGTKLFFQDAVRTNDDGFRLKLTAFAISKLAPIVADVVKQGICENTMQSEHPLVFSEIVIAAENMIFKGPSSYTTEELEEKVIAFVRVHEILWGLQKGDLAAMIDIFKEEALLFNKPE